MVHILAARGQQVRHHSHGPQKVTQILQPAKLIKGWSGGTTMWSGTTLPTATGVTMRQQVTCMLI